MNYFVTRHPATLEWLHEQVKLGIIEPGVHLSHIHSLDTFNPGDCIIGTLPIDLVAEICALGAQYLHIELKLPKAQRGKELSHEELLAQQPILVEYQAFRPIPDSTIIKMANERDL